MNQKVYMKKLKKYVIRKTLDDVKSALKQHMTFPVVYNKNNRLRTFVEN